MAASDNCRRTADVFFHPVLRTERGHHTLADSTILTFTVSACVFGVLCSTMEYYAGETMVTLPTVSVLVFCTLYLHPIAAVFLTAGTFGIFAVCLNAVRGASVSARIGLTMIGIAFFLMTMRRWILKINAAQAEEEKNELIEKFKRLSLYDELTALKNSYALREECEEWLHREITVMMADIDDFRLFNDTYGQEAGDRLMKEFASILTKTFGRENVYRYSGDSFLIITRTDERALEKQVKEASVSFKKLLPDRTRFTPTYTGAFITGVAQDEEELRKMRIAADEKLYIAKSMGKNRTIGMTYAAWLEEKEEEKRRRELGGVYVDSLTGLPGMPQFREEAAKLLASAKDTPTDFVYLNIINFKAFNEEYGFQEGDAFLKTVAGLISAAFSEHLIARLSDDRFVVCVKGGNVEGRLEDIYRNVYSYNDKTPMTIHAGIYSYDFDERIEVSVACDRAKTACDTIKNRYDIHFVYYDESVRNKSIKQQYILTHFEDALENGRIHVCFQPIVRVINGEVCGVEALARWEDPEYGLMPPGDFISTLEDFHLINRLDIFVVQKICENYTWLRDNGYPLLPFSVNLSRLDFELCDIVMTVKMKLAEYDMPIDMIHIEVTEGAFSGDQEFLKQEIIRFKQEGFQIWMDDFGSGYSSLNVLRNYPFDVIKLDMAFLKNFESNQKSRVMIGHIVSMAKEYGILTLAEGIESAEQFEYLRSVGCEMVQGYYFGIPHTLSESASYLASLAVRIEDVDSRSYFEAVGRINLLQPSSIDMDAETASFAADIPIAILESRDDSLRYFTANEEFSAFLAERQIASVQEYEKFINDAAGPMYRQMREAMEKSVRTHAWESMDLVLQGSYYAAWIREVASDEKSGAHAFLLVIINVSRYARVMGVSDAENVLRFLYELYNRVDLFARDGGDFRVLYSNAFRYAPGQTWRNVGAYVKEFAENNIFLQDRKAFLRFYNTETLPERIRRSAAGHVSAHFRTINPDGGYSLQMYVILPVELDGKSYYLSCVRDINEETEALSEYDAG